MFCAAYSTKHQPIKVNGSLQKIFTFLIQIHFILLEGVDFLQTTQWVQTLTSCRSKPTMYFVKNQPLQADEMNLVRNVKIFCKLPFTLMG